jgi:quercetin dioxygenase-like cupin family protein
VASRRGDDEDRAASGWVAERFSGGATYQGLVGDAEGSTSLRVGVRVSPAGCCTPTPSRPYLEVATILEGLGEARIAGRDALWRMGPGMTMALPPHAPHWFRNTGAVPLKTPSVPSSPHRIVTGHSRAPTASGGLASAFFPGRAGRRGTSSTTRGHRTPPR